MCAAVFLQRWYNGYDVQPPISLNYHSVPLSDIENLIKKYKVISFDIFDTLLVRPYAKPADLFTHVEMLTNVSGFAKARINASRTAHKMNSKEITYEEIYSYMPESYRYLAEKELQLEEKVLKQNPDMMYLFNYALRLKKRIILVSDMYLPSAVLARVLRSNGFNGYKKMYVSCEYGSTKWSGKLFDEVIRHEHVRPGVILHLGDNSMSDSINPMKRGISTILYKRHIDFFLSNNTRAKVLLEKHPHDINASILLGMLSLYRPTGNYWFDFGYTYAGPAILGMLKWLDKEVKKKNISDILFVARDGYTLVKVYKLIQQSTAKSHYPYAPRKTLIPLNFNYNDSRDTLKIMKHYKPKSEFLRTNTPVTNNVSEAIRFIEEHTEEYKPFVEEERKEYANYLKQFCPEPAHLAFVDSVTYQSRFTPQRAVVNCLPDYEVDGFYWFVNSPTKTVFNWTSYQTTHGAPNPQTGIIELFFTAPTPPIDRFENNTFIFAEPNENEQIRIQIYPDISAGAVAFAKDCVRFFGKDDLFFTASLIADWVNLLCDQPTEEDKDYWRSIRHSASIDHSQYEPVMKKWYQ